MSWSYRPALDGLRTLAVYLVVLFHCGVGYVEGGFVGVDLFFVLSGFLVTTILLEELRRTGRLDLAHFYDRRIRRLLPAALVVVLAVSAMSLVLLSTVRRAALVGDAQSALLYVANWRFLLQTNDYFAAGDVDSSPFLHFWSLSIEEQFYFFFPLLLIGLARLERRRRGAMVTVLTVAFLLSLGAQLVWASVDTNHAYYGTEARLYQLLAGSLLALASRHGRRAQRSVSHGVVVTLVSVASLVGLVVVASSALDLSPSTRGVWAMLFSVGLVATLAEDRTYLTVRLFSRPSLVYLGKISYGTYLWHWPVVVLLREVLDSPVWVRTGIVVGLSTALAAASYQMLERPIRSRKVRPRLQTPVAVSGLVLSAVVAVVVVPRVLDQDARPDLRATAGVALTTERNRNAPVPDLDLVEFKNDKGPQERWCPPENVDPCNVVGGRPGPDVVLVGDSYGQMLARGVTQLAKEHDFNLWVSTLSGCPWQEGLVKPQNTPARQTTCAQARDALYHQILDDIDADVVMLTERARDRETSTAPNLVRPPGDDRPIRSRDALLAETTNRTFDSLHEAGVRTLVFTSIFVPGDDAKDPLDCLSGARYLAECRVPVVPRTSLLDSLAVVRAATSDDVVTVDINPIMCPAAPVCEPVLDGIPVWRDKHHYSPALISHEREAIFAAIEETGILDSLS